MPRKLVYRGGAADSTYIYDDKGELVGIKGGDQTGDSLLASDSWPLENTEGVEKPNTDPHSLVNKVKKMEKDFVVNTASQLPFMIPGGGTIGTLARILGSLGVGYGTGRVLGNTDTEAVGDALINTAVGGATGGLLRNKITFHPNVRGGVGMFGRLFGTFDPRGIKISPRTEVIRQSLGKVPKGTTVTIPETVPEIPGMPREWQAKPTNPLGSKTYKGGQQLPYVNKEIPVKASALKRMAAGVGANEVIDLGPLINDLFRYQKALKPTTDEED